MKLYPECIADSIATSPLASFRDGLEKLHPNTHSLLRFQNLMLFGKTDFTKQQTRVWLKMKELGQQTAGFSLIIYQGVMFGIQFLTHSHTCLTNPRKKAWSQSKRVVFALGGDGLPNTALGRTVGRPAGSEMQTKVGWGRCPCSFLKLTS